MTYPHDILQYELEIEDKVFLAGFLEYTIYEDRVGKIDNYFVPGATIALYPNNPISDHGFIPTGWLKKCHKELVQKMNSKL